MVTDVIKLYRRPHGCDLTEFDNKNGKFKMIKYRMWLSIYRMLYLLRKPQLGRTKPSTGPHAARGLGIPGLDSL